jgi:predicted ATPase
MGGDYSLASSQRTSLLAYLQTPVGRVTAINGPPGTGKTTLLQSVVATEMVSRAVAQAEAPLFIAGAATNQAVARRWYTSSFASRRLASNSKRHQRESKKNGKWTPRLRKEQTYIPHIGRAI